jgi:hypothetical protein
VPHKIHEIGGILTVMNGEGAFEADSLGMLA